ncbi:hypothetical protein BCR34DRAFT_596465 [Clohesyomyces aquaticus]|uniref:AAA+ ATPase domain-containing protein n=1 Tax=Clohesyomyces aquaticus TaxID=1231657 RepID=A0A1Y2A6S9_9PLEO|nr:hypothetical protein BCR34DRAFT_596465 [Clohesyomyces aquaticus]
MGREFDREQDSPPIDTPMSSIVEMDTVAGAEVGTATPANDDGPKDSRKKDNNPKKDDHTDTKTSATEVISNAKFVKTVSEFVKKLGPWKGIMPDSLLDDLMVMEAFAKEVSGEMDANDPSKWTCEIERGTMEDWRKLDTSERKGPKPVIEAYYLHKPDSPRSGGNGASPLGATALDALGDHKNLQRIQINSDLLQTELESIAGLAVPTRPIRIAPPYKLLLRFFPAIESRLLQLQGELKDLDASKTEKVDAMQANNKDSEGGTTGGSLQESISNQEHRKQLNSRGEAGRETADAATRKSLVMRYEHLKCLQDFIKNELHDILMLREKIRDGTLKTIQFEDLWHMFEPGELIWSTDNGHDQIYKVYSTTGGQIQRRSRTRFELQELEHIKNRATYWREPPKTNDEEQEIIEQLTREEASGIGTWTSYKVDCYTMEFNGEHFGPVEACKKIRHYVGERQITTLPMFPVRFHPQANDLLRRMELRGKRFITSAGHKSYEGRTLAFRREEGRVEIQSDVYIDFDAYYQDYPTRTPKIGQLLRSKQDLAETDEAVVPGDEKFRSLSGHEVDLKLADDFMATNRLRLERFKLAHDTEICVEDLYLMPYYVVGYAFQVRKWFTLDLDLVKDIDQKSADARASGFEDLVIPDRYRNLLVALVENHASGLDRQRRKVKNTKIGPLPTQIDLVRGKGQGLIILLHGPPGSGKTSTAETIAAFTRRPLYSITCGDIGLTPDVVESRLLDHTRRADKWGCVLLLDEADVFLMQRNWRDLERNALVSVFLRQLEYYSGILFLTTNRPGVLDEAFKSRIHISLRYPSIDLESTRQMWSNIMNRVEQDNASAEIKVKFEREALLEYAKKHFVEAERTGNTWNGRQIRNAFQTALALGHYERLKKIRESGMTVEEAVASGKKKWMTVKLTKANFTNIARTAKEFEEYIEELRGKDSEMARQNEWRLDGYDPDAPPARKNYASAALSTRLRGAMKAPLSKPHSVRGKKGMKEDTEEEDEEEEDSEDLSPDEDD